MAVELSALPERLAVIRDERDDRIVVEAAPLQFPEQPADTAIRVRDLAVVEPARDLLERLGHAIDRATLLAAAEPELAFHVEQRRHTVAEHRER